MVGYQTNQLPAFYTRDSGYAVDYRCDTPEDIATMLKTKWDLNLRGGMVIANPVPEIFALDSGKMEKIINQAHYEASDHGISGKHVTPYMLRRIEELTAGNSLHTNIQLVLNNARLGAQIAVAYADLSRETP